MVAWKKKYLEISSLGPKVSMASWKAPVERKANPKANPKTKDQIQIINFMLPLH